MLLDCERIVDLQITSEEHQKRRQSTTITRREMPVDEILCKLTANLFPEISTRGAVREQLTVWDLDSASRKFVKSHDKSLMSICHKVNASKHLLKWYGLFLGTYGF